MFRNDLALLRPPIDMRRIITAVGILLGVANGCLSPSSAATWPDCSRVFEKVAFTSGTISAVCVGKIAKTAAAAAAQATVQHLEQDLAKLPFGEARLGAVAAQEGKVVEKTASIVTMAKPEAAAAAASKVTAQDVRASSVAFEQKIRQREFGFAKDVDAAAAAVAKEAKSAKAAAVAKKDSAVVPLVEGEGRVGTYKGLKEANPTGSGLAAHHVPQKEYIARYEIPEREGVAINVQSSAPGTSGRHGAIHSKLPKKFAEEVEPRDALARSVQAYRETYAEQGLYDETTRACLQEVIRQNQEKFPHLYEKKVMP